MTAAMTHWRGEVSRAACAFESRWTWLTLRRVSSDLATRLHEQRALFDAACVTGRGGEIEEQGAALCRGYAAVVRCLEAAGAGDDAYLLGHDSASGLRIAIGEQRAAAERVRELHGDRVVWVTPDECARMLASVEQFKFVGAVKQFFPGAEIIERYPDQPSQHDDAAS